LHHYVTTKLISVPYFQEGNFFEGSFVFIVGGKMMIYTLVLNRGGTGVQSPADKLGLGS
jgi:hypothetical protein